MLSYKMNMIYGNDRYESDCQLYEELYNQDAYTFGNVHMKCTRQFRREGGKLGKVFPGPATFGGRHRSKILKMVFQVASF